jgi:hypothetical protein
MAGLIFEVNIPQTALAAGTAQTVGFVTSPTNQRVKIKAYGFYFDGTTNSATPIQIQLCRPGSGTFTALNGTATPAYPTEPELTETIQSKYGVAASPQPTTSLNVFKTITVHPQLGYEYIAPLGEEEMLAGGTTWCALATAQAAVNIRGYFRAEE